MTAIGKEARLAGRGLSSEGRPAYHLPPAGVLAGLAAGDLLLGLNPELLRADLAARLLLVAGAAGAAVASLFALVLRGRRASRAGAALLGAGLLAAFGVFVEFQREALYDFVPAGARRVLVATSVAAFLSAVVFGARAVRGGLSRRNPLVSAGALPPAALCGPARSGAALPGGVPGAPARAGPQPSRRRARGRLLEPCHDVRVRGRNARRRAALARGDRGTARGARSVRSRRALDDGRNGKAPPEARRRLVAPLADPGGTLGSCRFCPARPSPGASAPSPTRRRPAVV